MSEKYFANVTLVNKLIKVSLFHITDLKLLVWYLNTFRFCLFTYSYVCLTVKSE